MKKFCVTLAALVLAFGLTLGGCDKKEEAAAKGAETAAKATDKAPAAKGGDDAHTAAMVKWDTLCASCHGKTGQGDGAAAAALDPKPRSFSDAEWHKATDDAKIAKAIVEGGPAVGLAVTMPPNPDLKGKPEVVKALVKHIRSLKK